MFIGKKKEIHCKNIDEFNTQLKIAKDISSNVFFTKYDRSKPIGENAYLETTDKYFKLTYKLGKEKLTYVVDRNGETITELPTVAHVMKDFSQIYKVQRVSDYMTEKFDNKPYKDGKIGYRENIGSASPIRDSNKKYWGKAVHAIEYDLSSAYGQFLKESLPDLSTVKYNAKINKGQIGFVKFGSTSHGFPRLRTITSVGDEADYVFDLMESPYADYVDKIFDKILSANTKEEKDYWKFYFRGFVGQLQNVNPFWRAIIVEKCNDLVKSLLRDDSIYWSTDSIVSENERFDILATGYKWKIKHNDIFKLKDRTTYQWGDEIPKWNGKKKLAVEYYNMTHEKKFDLLTDKVPTEIGSKYVLNKDTVRIELNAGVL